MQNGQIDPFSRCRVQNAFAKWQWNDVITIKSTNNKTVACYWQSAKPYLS